MNDTAAKLAYKSTENDHDNMTSSKNEIISWNFYPVSPRRKGKILFIVTTSSIQILH
jgi:hypothetical protein